MISQCWPGMRCSLLRSWIGRWDEYLGEISPGKCPTSCLIERHMYHSRSGGLPAGINLLKDPVIYRLQHIAHQTNFAVIGMAEE